MFMEATLNLVILSLMKTHCKNKHWTMKTVFIMKKTKMIPIIKNEIV